MAFLNKITSDIHIASGISNKDIMLIINLFLTFVLVRLIEDKEVSLPNFGVFSTENNDISFQPSTVAKESMASGEIPKVFYNVVAPLLKFLYKTFQKNTDK